VPRYKIRRPNFGEVAYFPDCGVANSGLDVVYTSGIGLAAERLQYREHPSSCWQPQNQENNRLPLYSAYGLYNMARLQGGKNLEFRPRTKFV